MKLVRGISREIAGALSGAFFMNKDFHLSVSTTIGQQVMDHKVVSL